MATKDISADRVRELLDYNPATGIFTRRTDRGQRKAGSIAGTPRKNSYIAVSVDNVRYLAHRVAWLYVYGKWPDHQIDHIDGDRANNRIENLRDVLRTVNQQNQKRPQWNNKVGMLGVIYDARRNGYIARIFVNGRGIHLGQFPTAELAQAAYIGAKRAVHKGCTI